MQDKFQQAFWDYNQYNFYKAHGVDEKEYIIEARKKMREAYKSVQNEIPVARKKLEDSEIC